MHPLTKIKRFASSFLAASFLLSVTAYATLGDPLYDTSLILSDNAVFETSTAYHPQNGLENAFFLQYSPGGAVTPVVAYGSKLYGRSNINTVASYIKDSTGKTVVGGINGDFFMLETGIPVGLSVTDGVLRSSDAWQNAAGFMEDGSAIIGTPHLSMSVYDESTQVSIPVMYFNKARTKAGVYLFNEDFSAQTHISSKGVNVVLQKQEDKPVKIGDTMMLSVVSVAETSVSTPIAAGQMILTVDSTGPAERVAQLKALKPGASVKLSINPTDDARWNDIKYGIGGGKILVQDGQVTGGLENDVFPHTAVGIKSDGSVILFAVDGRQTGYSAGISQQDLASHMLSLGCVYAMNLDGGGSTTLGVVYPGDTNLSTANSPSDGTLRKCANYLMLVNNAEPTGQLAKLYIYPYDMAMLAGASEAISIKAVDSAYFPVNTPDNIEYDVPQELGRVENGRFYSQSSAAEGEITARTSDGISGTAKVHIYDSADVLTLHKSGETANLTSLSLNPGDAVDIDVFAYLNRRRLICDDSLFTFKADGGIGSIDAAGKFTATDAMGSTGTITVSYKSGISVSLPVSVGKAPELIDNFNSNAGRWAAAAGTPAGVAAVSTATGYSLVKYGTGALSLSYNFAASEGTKSISIVPAAGTVALPGGPGNVSLWVCGDGSSNVLSLNTVDSSGKPLPPKNSYIMDFTGYKQLSFTLPSGSAALSGFSFTLADGGKPSGALYFDHALASFGAAFTDTAAPVVEITSFPGSGDNTSTLAASVKDAGGAALKSLAISVKLDGADIKFSLDLATGGISADVPELSAGMHRITITASDISGNYSRASVSFKLSEKASTFADMTGHWSSPYVDFLADKKIATGELKGEKYCYSPERNTTRLEMAVFIAKYLGLDIEKSSDITLPFADLGQIPDWALPYVKAAYSNGIILGKTNNGKTYFAPTAKITRMETMTILGRTLPQGCQHIDNSFKDASDIAPWAKPYIENLNSLGIVAGYPDGSILPLSNIKRSEIASMLFKLY
ncbi:MAG: phosphodiester glycosidase family protein [Bacillota bacterium]|nr:phosphodiester glycosidase family protein [Bacillota bacterium]